MLCDDQEGHDLVMGDVGWEAQEEGDICIQMASLLCFTPETNTELYSNNTLI